MGNKTNLEGFSISIGSSVSFPLKLGLTRGFIDMLFSAANIIIINLISKVKFLELFTDKLMKILSIKSMERVV